MKQVEKLKNITKIYAFNGCEHIIAMSISGEILTYGYNAWGQLGHGNATNSNIPKPVETLSGKFVTTVSCSYYHTIFSCGDDMETYACGWNDYGQLGIGGDLDKHVPTLIEGLNGKWVTSIGCGQYHTIVTTEEMDVYSFGRNDSG